MKKPKSNGQRNFVKLDALKAQPKTTVEPVMIKADTVEVLTTEPNAQGVVILPGNEGTIALTPELIAAAKLVLNAIEAAATPEPIVETPAEPVKRKKPLPMHLAGNSPFVPRNSYMGIY